MTTRATKNKVREQAVHGDDESLFEEALKIVEAGPSPAIDSMELSVRDVFFVVTDRTLAIPDIATKLVCVVNTPPASRLHEIVLEMLAGDTSPDGPGPAARKRLFDIGVALRVVDRAKALRMLAYSEHLDFKCAMRMYFMRTSEPSAESHEEASAKIPRVLVSRASQFFDEVPDAIARS